MIRIDLAADGAHATLLPELGGRIAQCTLIDGSGKTHPLFFPFDASTHKPDAWSKGGLYPLVPFSGRIAQAQLAVHGKPHHLTPHSPADPHALHGIAQRRAWRVEQATQDTATLSYAHEPDAHWPWRFLAQMHIVLTPYCLQVTVSCQNTDDSAWPAGVGLHPYLHFADNDRLSFSAQTCWPADAQFIGLPGPLASGNFRPDDKDWSKEDLTQFYLDWHGKAVLHDNKDKALCISASESFEHVVLHKPYALPYLCVEPATHVPNAFNLADQNLRRTGCRYLSPGEQVQGWAAFELCSSSSGNSVSAF